MKLRRITLSLTLMLASSALRADPTQATGPLTPEEKRVIDTFLMAQDNPTVHSRRSPPVLAYLAEQERRRKINADFGVVELDQPNIKVYFDRKSYRPETGRLGFAREIAFIRAIDESSAIVVIEGTAVVLHGIKTEGLKPRDRIPNDKPVLVGEKKKYTTGYFLESVFVDVYALDVPLDPQIDPAEYLQAVPRDTPESF